MNKTNFACLGLVLIYILTSFSSCEKKEPANSPSPENIFAGAVEELGLADDFFGDVYNSGADSKKLTEEEAKRLYFIAGDLENKNDRPVDISKIEKYFVKLGSDNSPNEIGIFKIYKNSQPDYVKDMAKNRILRVQEEFAEYDSENENNALTTANSGEARSYGNYIYYVIHPEKDRIFEKIENIFRADS